MRSKIFLNVSNWRKRGLRITLSTFAGMFGGHLQATADVAGDEFARIFARTLVQGCVALVEQQVIAHTAADERLLDARQGVDGMIDVEQRPVVGVQVGAYLGMDARGALALLAEPGCAVHAVHIGRRASKSLR